MSSIFLNAMERLNAVSPYSEGLSFKGMLKKWDDFVYVKQSGFRCCRRLDDRLFFDVLLRYLSTFPPLTRYENFQHGSRPALGTVHKITVAKNSRIHAHGDYHGDLPSLIKNMRFLQSVGILDFDFKVTENALVVCLGDYVHRGPESKKILCLLMQLRLENPDRAFLLRGNHEETELANSWMHPQDEMYHLFSSSELLWGFLPAKEMIELFYRSLLLALYAGVEKNGKMEYIQFSHGLFPIYYDLHNFLEQNQVNEETVYQENNLSKRILDLASQTDDPVRQKAAIKLKRVFDAIAFNLATQPGCANSFLWADCDQNAKTQKYWEKNRGLILSEKICKAYFDLVSGNNNLVVIVKAHRHIYERSPHGKVHTLPASSLNDLSYLISADSPKISDWKVDLIKIPFGIKIAVTAKRMTLFIG